MSEDKTYTQEELNAIIAREKGKTDEAIIKERDQYKAELDKVKRATDAGLPLGYSKYIESDEDVEFFKSQNEAKAKAKEGVQRFVEKRDPKDAADAWAMKVEESNDD